MILSSVWRHLAPWHAENMHIFFHVILNENADMCAYVCVYVFGMGGPSTSTVQFSLLSLPLVCMFFIGNYVCDPKSPQHGNQTRYHKAA
jgi:hypothetical protein